MSRYPMIAVCIAVATTSVACSPEPRLKALETHAKELDRRVAALEQRQPAAPKRPDPSVVYRVPVEAGEPMRGAPTALVTLVEVYEHACPYCAVLAPVIDGLLRRFHGDLRIIAKPFVVHPEIATSAALAVCAAHDQGRLEVFEPRLWASAWQGQPSPRLNREALMPEALVRLATQVGLDARGFRTALDGERCRTWLTRNRDNLVAVGVRGTPSFFVNGRPYVGPRTEDGFAAVITEELRKAQTATANGISASDYYGHLMRDARSRL